MSELLEGEWEAWKARCPHCQRELRDPREYRLSDSEEEEIVCDCGTDLTLQCWVTVYYRLVTSSAGTQ